MSPEEVFGGNTPEEGEALPQVVNYAKDYITWIGARYYTASTFIAEAKTLGICRRVPFIPRGLKFGRSRIFFVTDLVGEAEKYARPVEHKKEALYTKKYRSFRVNRKKLAESGVQLIPHVIGYGVVTGILVVGSHSMYEKLAERGINAIYLSSAMIRYTPIRGCGTLKIGGTYLVDAQTLQSLVDSGALKREDVTGLELHPSTFVELNPPIPAPGLPRWRGLRPVYGEAILQRRPWQEWFEE